MSSEYCGSRAGRVVTVSLSERADSPGRSKNRALEGSNTQRNRRPSEDCTTSRLTP